MKFVLEKVYCLLLKFSYKKLVSKQQENRELWLMASVAGSFWGSAEIILGSFLHNIKFPFAGSILTLIGIFIMVSIARIWPRVGIFWRAGLVCAFLKSISPSAVIIGPMTAILTEAIALELGFYIFRKTKFGLLIGGGFAALSTFLHLIISKLIYFGSDLYLLYASIIKYYSQYLTIDNNELTPLLIIGLIYFILGLLVSLIAIQYQKHNKYESDKTIEINNIRGLNKIFYKSEPSRYSWIVLLLHLISIVGILYILNIYSIYWAWIPAILYIVLVAIFYRRALRRLAKPLIYIQIIVITFLSGIFMTHGVIEKGLEITYSGIMTGLSMNLRSILLIISFAAISIEIRNPVVSSFLKTYGPASLHAAIETAFGIMPVFASDFSSPKKYFKRPVSSFSALISKSILVFNELTKSNQGRNVIFITDSRNRGKSLYTKDIANALIDRKIDISGIISIGVFIEGEKSGFKLIDEQGNYLETLALTKKTDNWFKHGRFYFNPDAFTKGTNHINMSSQFVIIDEIGRLELKGGGWSNLLETVFNENVTPIITINEKFINRAIIHWNIDKYLILKPDTNIDENIDRIIDFSKKYS